MVNNNKKRREHYYQPQRGYLKGTDMNEDNMSEWVNRAKATESDNNSSGDVRSVKVVRKEVPKNTGQLIMEMADKLRPYLTKWFDGKYNDDGMLIQPAHIRGFAIEMAENLIKKQYHNDNKASA